MLNLTLLIAVRNGENFLEETLKSLVLVGKKTGCIILVSDNHSNDRTHEVLKSMKGSIEVIRPPELLGMAEHWTWATQQVQTKYVRLIGHDDFVFESNVYAQVRKLEESSNAVAVYSDRDYLLTRMARPDKKKASRGKRDHKLINQTALLKSVIRTGTNGVGEPFCVTFRTELFKKNKNPLTWSSRDPIYELETYFSALKYGELAFCPGKAGLFRVHSNSYSSGVGKYFWQASEHRNWVHEKISMPKLNIKDEILLNLTTRMRAIMRFLVFWWIKL
jgi:glycosyltransferase involved in cell wall biosynthesis